MPQNVIRTCARAILANILMGIPPVARMRARRGRTSKPAAPDLLDRYAFDVFRRTPEIQPYIDGADILEIGPGDHLASGLSLLAYGAKSYTVMDRFQGDYRSDSARGWYRMVREKWGDYFPNRPWPEWLDVERFPDLQCVSWMNLSTEDLDDLPRDRYDVVISKLVGEHVRSIEDFADATYRMLKPGGIAMHIFGFDCHGFFRDDPLYFLTIPEPIWRMMGSNRGIPNRKRAHEVEAVFRSRPFLSVEVVQRKMKDYRIPTQLRHLPADSLRTERAIFVLRK